MSRPTCVLPEKNNDLCIYSLFLDYFVLTGIPGKHNKNLQSVQNAAARLIYSIRRSEHITDALISLHWLRVQEGIVFKVAVLTYRVHGTAPPYLS